MGHNYVPKRFDTFAGRCGEGNDEGVVSQVEFSPNGLEVSHTFIAVEFVNLGCDEEDRHSCAPQQLEHLVVALRGSMPGIEELNDKPERVATSKVGRHYARPLLFNAFGDLRIAVAREIDKVEPPVDIEKVDGLRFAGSAAGLCEALPVQERVEKARLSDVRAPNKGDLGAAVARAFLGAHHGLHECGGLYFHGRTSGVVWRIVIDPVGSSRSCSQSKKKR